MQYMPLARCIERVSIKADIVLKPFLYKCGIEIKANTQPPLFSYNDKYGSGYDLSYPEIKGAAPIVIE
jgi:hypothetical protein